MIYVTKNIVMVSVINRLSLQYRNRVVAAFQQIILEHGEPSARHVRYLEALSINNCVLTESELHLLEMVMIHCLFLLSFYIIYKKVDFGQYNLFCGM